MLAPSSWNGLWNEWLFSLYRDLMAHAGTGHIEQLPSGSYRVHVYAGTDPLTGRELRHRQTVKTEARARVVLGKLLERASAAQPPESGVTVGELLDRT